MQAPKDSTPISIHALREEGDNSRLLKTTKKDDFYPRPPRGGRLRLVGGLRIFRSISIHALREEGDSGRRCPDGST